MNRGLYQLQYMENTFVRKTHIEADHKAVLNMIIDYLWKHKKSEHFKYPVDYVKLQIPDYPSIIRSPMDLSTVRSKLKDYKYYYIEQCLLDLHLIWRNCRTYNSLYHWIVKSANELEEYQKKMTKNYLPQVKYLETHEEQYGHLQREAEPGFPLSQLKGETTQNVKLEVILPNSIATPNDPIRMDDQNVKPICPQQNANNVNDLHHKSWNSYQSSSESEVCVTEVKANRWKIFGRNLRKNFLKSLQQCNDSQASLIFLMIKRRCFLSIDYDCKGNAMINLQKVDDYTLNLAKSQIDIWINESDLNSRSQ